MIEKSFLKKFQTSLTIKFLNSRGSFFKCKCNIFTLISKRIIYLIFQDHPSASLNINSQQFITSYLRRLQVCDENRKTHFIRVSGKHKFCVARDKEINTPFPFSIFFMRERLSSNEKFENFTQEIFFRSLTPIFIIQQFSINICIFHNTNYVSSMLKKQLTKFEVLDWERILYSQQPLLYDKLLIKSTIYSFGLTHRRFQTISYHSFIVRFAIRLQPVRRRILLNSFGFCKKNPCVEEILPQLHN